MVRVVDVNRASPSVLKPKTSYRVNKMKAINQGATRQPRKPAGNKMILSALALAISAFSTGAIAQEAPESAVEEVVVTGIRASLASALNEKRYADNLVEVIQSEDIGKLPDQNLAEVLENVAVAHPSITPHVCDVTEEADIIALFDKMECADIVIANAGAAASAPFDKTSLDLWRSIMDVNLTGVFLTLREGLRRLKASKRPSGRLIAISSITGKTGYPYISAYAASKHGVLGLVKVAALVC